MARVLVVSSDERDYRVALQVLSDDNFVQYTASGVDACLRAEEAVPDVIIVGQHTSDREGSSVVRYLRSELETDSLLVMAVDERDRDNRMQALRAGADATMAYPLDAEEVELSFGAMMRWRTPPSSGRRTHGSLCLDTVEKRVYARGVRIDISPGEYRLLEALMEEPGRTLSSSELLQRYYGTDDYTATGDALRMAIKGLRDKIGHAYIENVYGHGYRVTEKTA